MQSFSALNSSDISLALIGPVSAQFKLFHYDILNRTFKSSLVKSIGVETFEKRKIIKLIN